MVQEVATAFAEETDEEALQTLAGELSKGQRGLPPKVARVASGEALLRRCWTMAYNTGTDPTGRQGRHPTVTGGRRVWRFINSSTPSLQLSVCHSGRCCQR